MVYTRKRKILIIEDSKENIDILIETLKDTYEIYVTINAENALNLLEKKIPDLIVLDLILPGLSGFEFCKIIKNIEFTKNIPIIFLSGINNKNMKNQAFQLGCVDYITKPFDVDEVKSKIEIQVSLQEYQEKLINQNIILEKSRQQYRNMLQQLPYAILIHNNKSILYCNHVAAIMLSNGNEDAIIGKHLHSFVTEESKIEVNGIIDNQLKNPTKEIGSIFINNKNTSIEAEITVINYMYNKQDVLLIVLRDLTKQKEIETLKLSIAENKKQLLEAQEYDDLRTEFFSNISHEFKTPINVMLSTLQLMDFYMSNPQQNIEKFMDGKYLSIIKQNCFRLLKLSNNLIDITRIDSDFYELNISKVDIVNLVEDISLSIVDFVNSKGLELVFDTNIEEFFYECDPAQLERILLNLLSNAVKFTPEGGKIEVKVEAYVEIIRIIIKDNGKGIPEDKINFVFERFRQIDKSLRRENEGSGIGLALVKSLVEKMDGKVKVVSKLGSGSEFIIEFRVQDENNDFSNVLSSKSIINHRSIKDIVGIEFSDLNVRKK